MIAYELYLRFWNAGLPLSNAMAIVLYAKMGLPDKTDALTASVLYAEVTEQ